MLEQHYQDTVEDYPAHVLFSDPLATVLRAG